jgi:hypothetical protein
MPRLSHSTSFTVLESLRLRAWALHALSVAMPVAPPPVSGEAWLLFLAGERCAVPLLERLRGARMEIPDRLGSEALRESQRVLGARRELRRLDAIAAGHGGAALVLKGGVAVARGLVLDLVDVDVLVPPDRAGSWEEALIEGGWHAIDGSVPRAALRHHHPLGAHVEAGGLRVEIHTRIPEVGGFEEALARSRPLPGHRTLRSPGALDQAWHVLVHATVQHPERRGCIRDLLLLEHSMSEMTAADAASLRARADGHPVAAVGEMLTMVDDLLASRAPTDRFTSIRALDGLLRGAGRARSWLHPAVANAAVEGAFTTCVPGSEWASRLLTPTGHRSTAPLAWGLRAIGLVLGLPWSLRARSIAGRS